MYLSGSFYQKMNQNMAALSQRVTDSETKANQLQTSYGPISTDVSSLKTRVSTAETNITSLAARVGAAETAIQGKAAISHTHDYSTLQNKPRKVFPFKATVAGGVAVFYLTVDGTANGAPFFANGPDLDSMQLTAQEGTNPHAFGEPMLSNSNKTLTVPVSKVAPILGILNVGQPANGSVVRLLIAGAS